jgi:hypothetical protein
MSDTVRRERGGLEELVLAICNRIENASEGDGIPTDPTKPWTPHRLAAEVAKAFPGAGAAPSTGAISDTLRRWREYGFAVVSEGPLSFDGFTPEAKTVGLAGLKEQYRANRPPRPKKNTAALSGTVTTQVIPQVPAEDHDGHTVVIEGSGLSEEAVMEKVFGIEETTHHHDDEEYAQGDPHPDAQDDVQTGWKPRDEWDDDGGEVQTPASEAEEGEPAEGDPLSEGRFTQVRRVDMDPEDFESFAEDDPFRT